MSIQDWDTFGTVAGGASGALIGLLFVAISLNRDRIIQHPALRASALQTLVLFMLPLVVSVLLVTPQQPSWLLGAEFILLGAITAVVLVIAGRGKRILDTRLARVLDQVSPNNITTLLILITGGTLVAGHGGGLFWLVPTVLSALISGVVNAWLFLMVDPD
ncbi:MAG: hypothetical protein ACLQUY_05510 [Ktedonobacterales bacterium]